MSGWIRDGNGLYVRARRSAIVLPDPVLLGHSAGDRPRRSATIANWIQAVAALTATVVSSLALFIAIDALRDQQQVSGLAMDRFERRYAERVAWWATRRDRGTIFIQNRSPVPILDVTIQMVRVTNVEDRNFSGSIQRRIGLQISDLPPCTMTEVNLAEPAMSKRIDDSLDAYATPVAVPGEDGEYHGSEAGPVLTYAVRFHDGNALWERQRSDLQQLSATLAEKDLTIVATTQSTKPVPDCGTDG
ncbi:hypothetical protein OG271_30490 [Micromonospora rifamycinica]|uniref:hypothetical protein n=1 Tax=Micromonospora rifamycinica TaxID=291594 RepID=UPI002E2B9B10|nr:hypothetical protein [Micromonospora rifamycinica]